MVEQIGRFHIFHKTVRKVSTLFRGILYTPKKSKNQNELLNSAPELHVYGTRNVHKYVHNHIIPFLISHVNVVWGLVCCLSMCGPESIQHMILKGATPKIGSILGFRL